MPVRVTLPGRLPVEVQLVTLYLPITACVPLWRTFAAADMAAAGIFVVGAVLSVFLHELAHIVVGRAGGLRPLGIHLNILGGMALFDADVRGRGPLWPMVVAGPASNLALGAALLLAAPHLAAAVPPPPEIVPYVWLELPPEPPEVLREAARWLGYGNLVFGAVNLLPAAPLDGGWLLGAALRGRLGEVRAARAVGASGMASAVIAGVASLMLILAGVFVWLPPEFSENRRLFVSAGAALRTPRG